MPDSRRLLAALQTLHADNTTGDISPQDNRDFLVSTYPDAENVLNHGAAGDGVADDQPEIQAAIDALSAGDTLIIPQGTYLLTAGGFTISTNDVTVIAYGATLTLNNDIEFLAVSATGVSIFGGTWDANGAQTGGKRLMHVTGDRFHLEDTTLTGSNGRSVNVAGSSNTIIRNNRITANVASAIFVTGATGPVDALNVLIEGNYIFQTGGTDADAIQGHATISGATISGLKVIGNHIEHGNSNFGMEIGRFSGDAPSGVVIANNRVIHTANGGGALSLSRVDDSSVTGNIFDSNGFEWSIAGIELVAVKTSIVDSNVINGLDTGGFHGIALNGLGGTDDNIISNNIINGWSNDSTIDSGINLEVSAANGTIRRNIITGNIIRFTTTTNAGVAYQGIRVFSNIGSAIIEDNVIIGNTIFGNGDTAIQGIVLEQGGGGIMRRTSVLFNNIIDTEEGIRRSSDVDSTMIGNRFTSVTSEFIGSFGAGGIIRTPDGGSDIVTLANDATPTVAGVALAKTGGTTTITDFDDGVVGQTFTLLSSHAVTITDATNMLLDGSADFVMADGDTLTLSMFNDQVWEEVARKTN